MASNVNFTMKPVSDEDVSLQLAVLIFSRSTGIGNILPYFLKDDKENVTSPLTHVTNLSILNVELIKN